MQKKDKFAYFLLVAIALGALPGFAITFFVADQYFLAESQKEAEARALGDYDVQKKTLKAEQTSNINKLKLIDKSSGAVEAPIDKDQKVATLKVVYDQELVGEYDLSNLEMKFTFLISSAAILSCSIFSWACIAF